MTDPELTSDAPRINGFAAGDRVAIVNCDLAGAYGKVEKSSAGCIPQGCRVNCRIVFVELMHIPEGVDPGWSYYSFGNENTYRFKVSEVTHVD